MDIYGYIYISFAPLWVIFFRVFHDLCRCVYLFKRNVFDNISVYLNVHLCLVWSS